MRVTLNDIARKAKVSRSTVGWVLSGRAKEFRISDATKEKVLQVSQELNYRPSFSAKSLAKGKTFTLGYICGDIETPYYSEIASRALYEADQRGYHLIIAATEWDFQKERDAVDMLLQGKVDGVMMSSGGLQPQTPEYEKVLQGRFPVVLLNCTVPAISSVCSDWDSGMDEALQYLRQKGHRCVGFTRYRMPAPLIDPKEGPFLKACERYGITPSLYEVTNDLDEALRVGVEIGMDVNRPSAIIANSDYLATALMSGLRQTGLDIPGDVAVVGIDGTKPGAYYYPQLTSISAEISTLAKASIDLLIDLVENRERGPKMLTLPTKLIIRNSV